MSEQTLKFDHIGVNKKDFHVIFNCRSRCVFKIYWNLE